MKKDKTRKELLQKELAAIEKLERKQLIDENYPLFKEKYEGKFFKYRNTYGGGSDSWNLYIKVTEIKPDDVYSIGVNNDVSCSYKGYSFQTDCYGSITIEQTKKSYTHLLEKEITEKEFSEAWNKMIDKMSSLP